MGLLIADARRRLHHLVQRRVRRYRLQAPQFWALLALRDQPGATIGELARRLGLDAPGASRLFAGLQKKGLLLLGVDPGDRRRSRLELSPAGQALCRELQPLASRLRNEMTAGMSAAEERALSVGLRQVVANLTSMQENPESAPAARKRRTA